MLQLQHTPPLQSTTPGLHPVNIHQMAPLVRGSKHPITAYYSVYGPQKYERLSWPRWLTCSGRFTHINGHPSAAGRAQDRKSSPTKDKCSNHCATPPTIHRNLQKTFKNWWNWFFTTQMSFMISIGRSLYWPETIPQLSSQQVKH